MFQFDPLLTQSIHWFTRYGKFEREETMCLLDAIFDAVCDEENATVRTVGAKYFKEFFAWSVKQTPPDLPVHQINHPR
jgi:hypothetical protein